MKERVGIYIFSAVATFFGFGFDLEGGGRIRSRSAG